MVCFVMHYQYMFSNFLRVEDIEDTFLCQSDTISKIILITVLKKKLYTVEDWKYMCMYMYTYMHVNRLTLCNTLYPIMMLIKFLSTSIIVSQNEGLVQLIQVSSRTTLIYCMPHANRW